MEPVRDQPLIFIVDDDEAVRDSLEAYLMLKGMTVGGFGSPLELIGGKAAEADLIIIDVNMPDMDGFTLLETLRQQGLATPAIFMTGLGDQELRLRAERAGAAAFFDKPVDVRALFEDVTRLLAARSG